MASKLSHLQTLRGLAATLVVADHALGQVVNWGVLPTWYDEVRFQLGGLGVSTFFVISGFIMVHTAYDDFGGTRGALSFASKRLIRIVPLYWLATLITVRHAHSIVEALCSFLFIPYGPIPGGKLGPLLGQGWTLNYEMFFYVLFTSALLFPRRIGLPGLFAAFIAFFALGCVAKPLSDLSEPVTALAFWGAPIILLFAVGMVIGLVERHDAGSRVISAPMVWSSLIFTVTMAVVIVLRLPNAKPFWQQLLFWVPGIVAVILCIFAKPALNGPVDRLFSRLGDASYSTYLFHTFVLDLLQHLFSHIQPSVASATIYVVVGLVLANLVGLLINMTVERRMTQTLTRWVKPMLPARTPQTLAVP